MIQPPPARRTPPKRMIVAWGLILILGVVTTYASFTVLQLPDAVTKEAADTKTLYLGTLIISMIVFFLVTAGLIYAIFRFKRENNDIPKQIHGSSTLEMIWTVIPIIILVALFIPALVLVIDHKTPPPDSEIDVEIEAIGHQWWWEFSYTDENLRVQQTPPNYADLEPPALVVPVGATVRVKVRSTDVIHSFGIPNALYKIQAIPGNVNQMHFTVEKAGVYEGHCYQFCGLRHSDMLFVLDAREPADYQRWLTETRAAQGVTPAADQALTTGQ